MKQLSIFARQTICLYGCLLLTSLMVSAQTPVLINDASPRLPVVASDKLYFFSTRLNFELAPISQLWKLSPGATTAELVTSLGFPSSVSDGAQAFGNRIAFFVNGPTGGSLWVSDGTVANTFAISNSSNKFQAVGDKLYYQGTEMGSNNALFVTDGTRNGNQRLLFLNFLLSFGQADGQLYLFQLLGRNTILSRLTPDGLVLVQDVTDLTDRYNTNLQLGDMVAAYGRVYFSVSYDLSRTYTIWQTNGTVAGTQAVSSGTFTLEPPKLRLDNGNLLVSQFVGPGRGATYPAELIVNKISPDNTIGRFAELAGQLPNGLLPGGIASIKTPFIRFRNRYYFAALRPDGKITLWRSDGQAIAGLDENSQPDNLTTDGNTLYFTAYDPARGIGLYKITGDGPVATFVQTLTTPLVGSVAGAIAAQQIKLSNGTLYYIPGVAAPGSTTTSTGFQFFALRDATPAIAVPTYDCTTGQLQINLTGNAIGAEYRIAGLRDWSASNVFSVPAWQRTGITFTLEVRQNGQTISQTFTTVCMKGPVGLTDPTYDCNTGNLTVNTTGNATGVELRIAGLRDWGINNVFTVPAWQRTGITFTIEARQSGQVVSRLFTTSCTPIPTGPFRLTAPTFTCSTGNLVLNGSGSTTGVEYRIAGLRDWGTSNVFTVPAWQRNGITFIVDARQNGQLVSQLTYTTACGSARFGTEAVEEGLTVRVGENPALAGSMLEVTVRGAEGKPLNLSIFDGQGRLLNETSIESAAPVEQRLLPTGNASGLLLLRATTGQQSRTLKLIRY